MWKGLVHAAPAAFSVSGYFPLAPVSSELLGMFLEKGEPSLHGDF